MSAPTLDSPVRPARIAPGQRALLLTLLIFLTPILIGGGLHLFGWRPASTGNHGQLVQPPVPVPLAALGPELAAKAQGKWLLVIAGDDPCAEACAVLAGHTRAVQVSLNREMGRIRRIVVSEQTPPALTELQGRQPDLLVTAADPAWRAILKPGRQHRLFVVDPAGNLMMQYAPEADPKGIRADLERLLKSSWIG